MELMREKNVATYIYFPLVDADGDIVSGAGALDSQIDTWANGTAPNGFVACTNEATEQGSTGVYSLSLTQSEMNNDYIYISIASTSAKKQHILIRTMSYADYKATGFSTHNASDIWSAGSRELSTPASYKADVSALATSSALATAQADLDNPNQFKASGFATHSAADVWTAATRALSTPNDYKADVSSLALEVSVQGLNDIAAAEVWAASGRALSTPDDYKANVAGLAPANEYDSDISAIKTKTDNLPADTAAELTRLRGLNGEFLVAEYTFSGDDNITLEFWQYDTLSNFNTHNKSTGLLGTWIINTTYSGGKPTVAKSKKLT